MTDEPTPDERDNELASLLEVPPLDGDARRRLVSRAIDEVRPASASRRPARALLAVAAVVVALVLLGVGVYAVVGRGGGTESATRAPAPKAATPGGATTSPDASPGAESAAGIRDLGDLGDVSNPATLRRAVGARLDQPPASARAAAPACLARAAAGDPPPSAYGTGTYRGRPVLVLLMPRSGDHTTAELLDVGTCRTVSVRDLG